MYADMYIIYLVNVKRTAGCYYAIRILYTGTTAQDTRASFRSYPPEHAQVRAGMLHSTFVLERTLEGKQFGVYYYYYLVVNVFSFILDTLYLKCFLFFFYLYT